MTWQEDFNGELMLWLYNTLTFLIFVTISNSFIIGFGVFLVIAWLICTFIPTVALYDPNYPLESTIVRFSVDAGILLILTGYTGIFCYEHTQLNDQQLICPWAITISDATKYKRFGPNVLLLCLILGALLRFLITVLSFIIHGVRAIRNRFFN